MKAYNIILYSFITMCILACSNEQKEICKDYQEQFANILDIAYTPSSARGGGGWFVDQGAWIGFTPPTLESPVLGFCGPYSLDDRSWIAKSAVALDASYEMTLRETIYYPGLLLMQFENSSKDIVNQRLVFADAHTALLEIESDRSWKTLNLEGVDWVDNSQFVKDHNRVIITHPTGEITVLSFEPEAQIVLTNANYKVSTNSNKAYIAISSFSGKAEKSAGIQKASSYLNNPENVFAQNKVRWNGYLSKILREDMPKDYDRIAVKSLVTLLSNWKTNKGGLLHEGIVPSHAVGYFMGFWAWDTWKFVIPLANITPELSKNMIRSMFDYQLDDGMIIDCIYVDSTENNARDSKPPLACWAVDAIYEATKDTAFLKEMYPQLLTYYKWWYKKRDHNQNGFCEFGSTDGTIEAAAWESGMDNAIRFDNAEMVKNCDDAWSFNQESVDLNAFLAYEYRLLTKFSTLLGEEFNMPKVDDKVADYFFDKETGFFYDKKISDGSFIREPGSEAYIPFWTNIATHEHMEKAMVMLTDTNMFSTYIPFPTVAANNPKYMSNGYWRGPIWLDQTYFAIKGLRNYGYSDLADTYTEQVFDRLDGLKSGAPIHENYDSHTGKRLKAPHFSWSASHLLLLYQEYKK